MPWQLQSDTPQRKRVSRTRAEIRAASTERKAYATRSATERFYETHCEPITHAEAHFRHSHWKTRREKVIAALKRSHSSERIIWSFTQCGSGCIIEWSETAQRHRLAANYCKNRHCEPCMRAKANKIAGNLREKLRDRKTNQYRFGTFTLAHTNAPLRDQIGRLYASFRKMRQCTPWKKSQIGGAAMLEVKFNSTTRQWHPHLHVIMEGGYIDKFALSKMWKAATGDSSIVHIKSLDDEKAAAHYVVKYVTKGSNAEVWDDTEATAEWLCSLTGVRTCATYGSWRGFALTKTNHKHTDWKRIGTYQATLAAARRAEEWAIAVLVSICPSEDPEEVRSRYQMATGDG